MEVEEIQANPSAATTDPTANNLSRIGNGRIAADNPPHHHFPPEDDDDDANRQIDSDRLRGWHHSSRIIRVSRASGGKDRHSKVWTSKGLRDRRVRLSVTTAIQFYDLQDRLGYDQPSKAVEWLINAASDAISELPSLNTAAFPDTPKQLSRDHHKPACSSASETSKGSGLSLSRSDIRVNRVKARERARERAAKDKADNNIVVSAQTSIPQNSSSFTELLTSGISNNNNNNNNGSSSPADHQLDYFSAGLNLSTPSRPHHMTTMSLPPPFGVGLISASAAAEFPSLAEQQLIPMAAGGPSQSSADVSGQSFWIGNGNGGGLAGFNRGTLQSNSSHHHHSSLFHHNYNNHHHFQRFSNSNTIDAANNIPSVFFAAADHHQHQFSSAAAFDARLHLCYGDAARHSDHKGKGKNSL